MTARKKRGKSETVNQETTNDNFEILHRIAFWGLALLLFFPPYFRGLFFAPEQEKALIFVTLVFWITFIWCWLNNDHKFIRGPLDFFVLALPVVYMISTFIAVNKGLAIDALVKNILYFLVYWSASRLVRNKEDIYKLMHVIYIGAIGVAFAGLATATGIIYIKDGFNVSQFGGFISSTFQYHNTLAIYLSVAIFTGIYMWYQSFIKQPNATLSNVFLQSGLNKLVSYLYACGNYLLLVVMFASKSRGVLIVFIIVFAIFLLNMENKKRFYILLMTGGLSIVSYILGDRFITLVQEGSNGQAWLLIAGGILITIAGQVLLSLIQNFFENKWSGDRKRYFIAFVSLVTMVLATGVIWFSGKPGVIEKITSFDYLWTAYQRIYYVESAIDMIKERPVLGWGGGGWQEVYEAFLNFRYATKEVHSYYFQVGVETGLVGIAIVMGILVSYIVTAYRLFKENKNNMFQRQLICLLFVIFLMVCGHALIDFDLSQSAITITLWCVFGMITALAKPLETKLQVGGQRTLKYITIVFATISMVIIFSLAGILLQANSYANTGYAFLSSNNITKEIEFLEKAIYYNPYNSVYHMYLSRGYANQGSLKMAMEEAKKAIDLSKYSFITRNNYIQIALAAGESKIAAMENELICGIAPNNIETYEEYARNYMNLGLREIQLGNKDDAKSYLNKVLNVTQLISQREKNLSNIDKNLWEGPPLEDTDIICLAKGQAAYCLGEFTDSLEYLQQVARTQNSDINNQVLLWQAMAQEKNGNLMESKNLIDQISKIDSQLIQSYETLKDISVL